MEQQYLVNLLKQGYRCLPLDDRHVDNFLKASVRDAPTYQLSDDRYSNFQIL